MRIDSRILLIPFLAQAAVAGAADDLSVGIFGGLVLPQGSTRGVLGARAGGILLGSDLRADLGQGHALQLGFGIGVANGGEEKGPVRTGAHTNFNSYRLGVDYLYYPFGAQRGPYFLVGIGGMRLRTRSERWMPSDSVDCLRKGHAHTQSPKRPFSEEWVREGPDLRFQQTQACGDWDSHPLTDTGTRLGVSAGVGFTFKQRWEVGLRCDGVQAFGHTLVVVGLTAGARF